MKKNSSKIKRITPFFWGILLFFTLCNLGTITFAQTPPTQGIPTASPIQNFDDVLKLIQKAAIWILSITVAVSVIMIVWGAFLFVTSGGNEKKVEQGRKTILWACVGVAVALLAQAIISVVGKFIG